MSVVEESKPTVEDFVGSLTGFDEIAVEQFFRKEMSELSGTAMMRALVFVMERRGGALDGDAYKTVMNAALKAVSDRFDTSEAVVSGEA